MMESNQDSTPSAMPPTPSARLSQEQGGRPLAPGWGIVMFPEPPHGLDIVAPDGRLLVTAAPGETVGNRSHPGSWPEGTRWESWFRTPSGRRCGFATHRWRKGQWRRVDVEILALPRIRICADWGGAFAWTQYRQATPLEGFFGDTPGLGPLEVAFQRWQERFESMAPWGDSAEPKGGWEPFAEDGLALCQELATWVGPDGYVLYHHPPARLGLRAERLLLTWDPEPGKPPSGVGIPGGSAPNLASGTFGAH